LVNELFICLYIQKISTIPYVFSVGVHRLGSAIALRPRSPPRARSSTLDPRILRLPSMARPHPSRHRPWSPPRAPHHDGTTPSISLLSTPSRASQDHAHGRNLPPSPSPFMSPPSVIPSPPSSPRPHPSCRRPRPAALKSKKGYEYESQSRVGGRANSKASCSSPIRPSPNLIAGFRQNGWDAARFRWGLFCPFRVILLSAREASTDGSEDQGGGGGPRRWKWNAPMRKF
jgi:hypothetical protein